MRGVFGLVLIIGMALAGFAVYTAKGYFEQQNVALAQQNARMAEVVPTVEVVAVNRVMAHGEQITAEDIELIQYAEPHLPEGVFKSVEEVFSGGPDALRVVLRPMEPYEPLLAVKVTDPGEVAGIASLLSRGMRAFTIKVDVSSGVSGFLFPGDRVDVYWTGRVNSNGLETDLSGEITKLIEPGVELVAVDQTAGSGRSGATIARTVTVQVTPDQVAALAQAQATGRLSLALVGREDDTVAAPIELDLRTMLEIERQAPEVQAEVEIEEVCTINVSRGGQQVPVVIPCSE